MLTEDNTRTIDEAYSSAVNASTIRLTPSDLGTIGDAEVLIASGWTMGMIGGALGRLQSEWDGASKPRLAQATTVKQFEQRRAPIKTGERMVGGSLRTVRGPDVEFAKQAAEQSRIDVHAWHAHEVALLLGRLKTLPAVREQMVLQLMRWEIEKPQDVAAAVIRWWLDDKCQACEGTGWEPPKSEGRQSVRQCKVCHGTSKAKLPFGEAGRKLAGWMDECVYAWSGGVRSRLRKTRR